MAKIKPVMQEFNTMAAPDATDEEIADIQKTTMTKIERPKKAKQIADTPVTDVQVQVVNPNRLAAAQDRIDTLDKIEAQNVALTKENSELTEKLAEYIAEVESLREAAKKQPKQTDDESLSISAALKKAEGEIAKLADENKKLRAENDEFLMKISELTFENAKLTAGIRQAEKTAASAPKQQNQPPRPVEYNPYRTNGYSTWN